ncbi:MAG: tetratricopeptide repeat protein [Oscillatoriales cyanobacterium]|nr:MAG: tetratricopeptide repeat protein [Oscillatoriales cyanobacterium]
MASYDRALEIKPDYLFAWSQRGLALENLQRYPEAETAYRKALSITERAFDYRNLGDVLRRQERYEESISSYTKALELDTDYSDVRYELGWTYACYLKPPNYAAAREVFESCLERNDSDPEAFYGFACIDSLQNNFEASLTHLQRAIEIDPSYRDRAKNDTDFDPIRHDPRFQALLNP